MKKIFYLLIVTMIFVSIKVYAEEHDVQAKYEVTYNVDAFVGKLNNNSIKIKVGDYELEFSSLLTDIDIVIIKTESDANNYAKSFTNSNENYYISFFKENKKITSGEIKIKVVNQDKVLNIYSNAGSLINKSSEYIEVNENDFFVTFEQKDFVVADNNSYVQDLEDIKLDSNSLVVIYNHKNNIVSSASVLGTGYRIKVTKNKVIDEYTIIVKGDVDSDGKNSVLDIVKINNHIIYEANRLDSIYSLAADYNKDGKINVQDIVQINNTIIGGN